MTSSRVSRLVWMAVFLPALWAVAAPAASGFPPITDGERALTQVRGYPGAVAVVLFEKADLRLRDYPREGSPCCSTRRAVSPAPGLTVERHFDVTTHRLGRELYAEIRNLYAQAEKNAAQSLVLVRRYEPRLGRR